MRRIAIVTPMLPVPHDRARGRYIHETARALATMADVRVFLLQLRYPRLPGLGPRSFLAGEVGADFRLDGVDVEPFTYPAVPGLSRALNGIVASRVLERRLRRFDPDLVLAYWVYPDGDAARRAARRLGRPCVIGALGSDIHVRAGLTALMTRHTIRHVDALLTVSRTMRRAAIARFGAEPAKVHTIVNGFDAAVFRPRPQRLLRTQLGIAADARLIIYVGRLVEAKGMRELLAAFRRLATDDPCMQLALVGDGVMHEELARMVRADGLESRVLIPGGLEPAQVADWIGAADLLTLPSWSEGYPNVVVEALACGRPVVATDVGGTHEIIHADSGILVPPRDAGALHEALQRALARSWDHAAIAASMQRTWIDVARDTLAVCEQVLSEVSGEPAAIRAE